MNLFTKKQKINTAEQFQNLIEAIVKGNNNSLSEMGSVTKKTIRAFLDGNKEESKKCLEFLEEHLICPICVEVVNEPTITTCHHTYCTYCLNKWMMKNDDSTNMDSKSKCPTCRSPITPPSKPSPVLGGIVEAVMKKHGKGKRPPKVEAVPTVKLKKSTHRQVFGPPPRHATNLDVIRLMYALRP